MAQSAPPRVTPAQIAAAAAARGYDPQAVLAVASREGLGGGIGDGGHAYGPFQLNNAGGVITQQYGGRVNDPGVQQWAWSPEGLNYALDRMGAAKGLHGQAAIKAIVTQFERPANPQAEIAGAIAAYGSLPGAAAGGAPQRTASGSAPTLATAAGAAPPPPHDFVPELLQLAHSAAGEPGQPNLQAFYGRLTQALQARSQPTVSPSRQPVPKGGLVAPPGGGTPPVQPLPAGRGRIVGNTSGEQPGFLASLAALAAYEHAPVEINSGYRSYAKQAQLYANRASNPNPVAPPGHSLHEQGLAADGTVGGVPLGKLPAAVLARFGLEPVPGDPVHVQVRR